MQPSPAESTSVMSQCFSPALSLPAVKTDTDTVEAISLLQPNTAAAPSPLRKGQHQRLPRWLASKIKTLGLEYFSTLPLTSSFSYYLSKCALSSDNLSSTVSPPILQISMFKFYPFSMSSPDQIPLAGSLLLETLHPAITLSPYLICLMCLSSFEGKARIECFLFPFNCLVVYPALGGDLWGPIPVVRIGLHMTKSSIQVHCIYDVR